jgi:hypothetical protein
MEDISCMEECIVKCTPTIPLLSTSSGGMAGFVNAHKVVAQRSAFTILENVQNDDVLEVRTKSFGHAGLKHSFSQVEGDLDLQEFLEPDPLPKKKATKKIVVIVTMKEEDEEGEKAKKVGKNCADGEVLHLIALRGEMELEFTKSVKKQVKFQLIETLEKPFRSDFCSVFIIETWM